MRYALLPFKQLIWRLVVVLGLISQTGSASTIRADLRMGVLSQADFDNARLTPRPFYACEIVELSFINNGSYADKFFDVSLVAVFTAPDGSQRRVNGFYYKDNIWMIRFRPDAKGAWRYSFRMTDTEGAANKGGGYLNCLPASFKGPVRVNPDNPYRWIFANGEPYYPVGLQDCILSENGQLNGGLIDGEGRNDNSAKRVSMDEYLRIYSQAGFNLFRFSQNNCSYKLFDDLDHYNLPQILSTDELLTLLNQHGFRTMFGFFGFYENFNMNDPELVAKQERFIGYCIARWSVYVDFWELLNESTAPDEWIKTMVEYIRQNDPDNKPINTSWERADLPWIDINSPHWYEAESELVSDGKVAFYASQWKMAGKPVIVGEQGNKGMNWDPLSALRMRIRAWTSLFEEIALVFWNTSWSKAGMCQGKYDLMCTANIYLGPEERGYIRILQDFSTHLDPDVQIAPVEVSAPQRVHAYGLLSDSTAAVYLHHYDNHKDTVNGLSITLSLPGESNTRLQGEWIDPATGAVIQRITLASSRQVLPVPAFTVDLALLVTSDAR